MVVVCLSVSQIRNGSTGVAGRVLSGPMRGVWSLSIVCEHIQTVFRLTQSAPQEAWVARLHSDL